MAIQKKIYTFDSVVRLIITFALLYLFVKLLSYLSDVLIPFAIALLLAYLINPLVLLVQKKIRNRLIAVLTSLVAVIAVFVLLAWIFIPIIISEITHMGHIISDLVTKSDLAEKAARRLPPDLWKAIKDLLALEQVQRIFQTDNFFQIVNSTLKKLIPGVWGLITGAATLLVGLVVVIVVFLYVVFLLLDYQKVKEGWKNLIPLAYRDTIIQFSFEFNAAMKRHFRAQALVASCVGVLFALGFWIIGLPMGIILGLFIGLLNMVPYLQIIGFVPAGLMALFHALEKGSSFWLELGLLILVIITVQTIQDTILVPTIHGKSTGLSPAMILLSLSIWGKLLGFLGLLLALPMTFLVVAYYKRFLVLSKTHEPGVAEIFTASLKKPEEPKSDLPESDVEQVDGD
jgi:predicted PurR-regulated permease PerM